MPSLILTSTSFCQWEIALYNVHHPLNTKKFPPSFDGNGTNPQEGWMHELGLETDVHVDLCWSSFELFLLSTVAKGR
jgi:hypothetical protein